jgi:hypothetical protein
MALLIEDFSWYEALLVIDRGVIFPHISEDADFRWNFPLDRTSLGQKCLDLGPVLFDIVIVNVTLPIHVENGRLVEIAHKTKCSSL